MTMKNEGIFCVLGNSLAAVVILLAVMTVYSCQGNESTLPGENNAASGRSSSRITWKDKFPSLWEAAYADKASVPNPEDLSYTEFVKAVAETLKADPDFKRHFRAYVIKQNVNQHESMLNGLANDFGMVFQYIKPGIFEMGSPEDELGRVENEIAHQVTLTDAFMMQTTEVTQRQWEAVLLEAEARGISTAGLDKTPSNFKGCGSECPVESVSWEDIEKWINILNQLSGKNYCLPTEAQWEYTARAGSASAFSRGRITEAKGCSFVDPVLDKMGWYCGNADSMPHPTGRKEPNAWALYDMHGNVWEWCQDWYCDYPVDSVADPPGPGEGSGRILRGGCWISNAPECRSAFRFRVGPGYRSSYIGFRLALKP